MPSMTHPPTPTLPPRGTAPDAAILDADGAILPEAFAGWLGQLRAAGWTVARIAAELGTDERSVWYWLADRHRPVRAIRRLAWRALWAPVEAEVMRTRGVAPAPVQARTRGPAEVDAEALAEAAGLDAVDGDALAAAIARAQATGLDSR